MTKKITWRAETRKLADLRPWDRNPRIFDQKGMLDLTSSVERFGLAEPLVINTDGLILGGHARYTVLLAQGETEALCMVPSRAFTEKEIEEINIRLNANHGGKFDWDALANEWNQDELADWGLDIPDFDKPISETEDDDFETPDNLPKTDIIRGDIIEIGPHRLICGDSTNADDVAKVLAGAKPELMITDPPYGVNYDADWRNHTGDLARADRAIGKVENDDRADWSAAFALSPSKISYVWHASSSAVQFALDLMKCDFEIRSQIIWNKNNIAISRGHYHWKHEPCWYAVKKGATANWIGDRKQNTVWDIDKPQKSETGHSTQKPVECMARPMQNHSGDVYEPFAGSGTTFVAAHQLGRKCYGIEINPQYCQIIIDRMKALDANIEIKINGNKA